MFRNRDSFFFFFKAVPVKPSVVTCGWLIVTLLWASVALLWDIFGNISSSQRRNCISQCALPSCCCSNTLSLANTPCHRCFYLRLQIKSFQTTCLNYCIAPQFLNNNMQALTVVAVWDFTHALLAMWNTTKTLNCSKPEVEKMILAVLLNVATKFQIVWEQQKFCSLFFPIPSKSIGPISSDGRTRPSHHRDELNKWPGLKG